ncbi:MAG: bifunctional aconitate hydratase 2/2-methylisocitrate dehydratase [Deltaproteobacteria bacterium]|nr:bifunctional aconitate hydratase 2/2-methylisocitrate dehydratase [Deltaproteobacteria bacterium]
MIDSYFRQETERNALGIPPQPLNPDQIQGVCILLQVPPKGKEKFLMNLFRNRVSPGVDPAAGIKANFLRDILSGRCTSSLISRRDALRFLGEMKGGYNVPVLVDALKDEELGMEAAAALSRVFLVYEEFQDVAALADYCPAARKVLESWAAGDWFLSRPPFPDKIKIKVFKVEGEVNTDDLSPAGASWSRADIPLHALTMGKFRFPGGLETINQWRLAGDRVAFVADVLGTGSSRKSACNNLLWHIGEDIPQVPNKRCCGIVIGGVIAPIFFNTVRDSGALPLSMDVSKLKHGDQVVIHVRSGLATDTAGNILTTFSLQPSTLADEFRAGGRIPLHVGRALTLKARALLDLGPEEVFIPPRFPKPAPGQAFTLAQKIVGKACGLPGVLPGTVCEPQVSTVGSQDATGPMTMEEIKGLGCLKFQAPLFLQSFCHTSAYPQREDLEMHQSLAEFIIGRGGLALHPGDGVIHCWINRMLMPDTVGVAGDSHTRFPLGLSFPAGSGMVAFAGALGFMLLDMPESVLVRFKGKRQVGITLRDLAHAIPFQAVREGLLTVPKLNKKNVFNGRILEIEGLSDLVAEQAFELANSSAERSAAAACLRLTEEHVKKVLRSNIALMRRLAHEEYHDSKALEKRVRALEHWLRKPELLSADATAGYAATLEIDLEQLKEPLVACPNDPDDVRLLSEVAGTPVQDVFIGSCLTHIGHFRAAAEIWRWCRFNPAVRIWICPPTRIDYEQLKEEGLLPLFSDVGARIEPPGCSLCMGNQARVPDGVTVFSTSTRNFDDRIGDGAKVFLGSAEVAAVTAMLGRIPSVSEYLEVYKEKILPQRENLYRFFQFNEMKGY